MKRFLLLILTGFLLVACNPAMEEAYYVDREFGKTSLAAWDREIANPGLMIDKVPAGMEGITAEEVIDVHNESFGDKPTQTNVLTLELSGK